MPVSQCALRAGSEISAVQASAFSGPPWARRMRSAGMPASTSAAPHRRDDLLVRRVEVRGRHQADDVLGLDQRPPGLARCRLPGHAGDGLAEHLLEHGDVHLVARPRARAGRAPGSRWRSAARGPPARPTRRRTATRPWPPLPSRARSRAASPLASHSWEASRVSRVCTRGCDQRGRRLTVGGLENDGEMPGRRGGTRPSRPRCGQSRPRPAGASGRYAVRKLLEREASGAPHSG